MLGTHPIAWKGCSFLPPFSFPLFCCSPATLMTSLKGRKYRIVWLISSKRKRSLPKSKTGQPFGVQPTRTTARSRPCPPGQTHLIPIGGKNFEEKRLAPSGFEAAVLDPYLRALDVASSRNATWDGSQWVRDSTSWFYPRGAHRRALGGWAGSQARPGAHLGLSATAALAR